MIKHFYSVVLLITLGAVAALAQNAAQATAPAKPAAAAPTVYGGVTPVPSLPPLLPLPSLAPQAASASTPSTLALAQVQDVTPAQESYAFTMNFDSSYLGVFLEEVSPERAKELGLSEERGAVVMKVVQGSPAEKAGIKENDVIVAFNGRRVDSVRELQRLMSDTPAGRNVAIEVIRGGGRQTITATMGKHELRQFGPFQTEIRKETEKAMKEVEKSLKDLEKNKDKLKWAPSFNFDYAPLLGGNPRLGITADNLTEQLGNYFGVKDGHGVLVSGITENSPAARAGLKAGDVIVAVDSDSIQDVSALRETLRKKDDGAIKVKVMRDRHEHTLTVNLEKKPATRLRTVGPAVQRVKVTAAPRRLI